MVAENKNPLSKSELRAHFKAASSEYLRAPAIAAAIVKNLKIILPINCTIGVFRAVQGEPNMDELFESSAYHFAYPRIKGDQIEYFSPKSQGAFDANEFGILEPKIDESEKVDVQGISAILVPAIAYDRKLSRLGRGKGFYDRLLAHYKGLKIGVCSVVQVSNQNLPLDPHDIAMDIVVTDQFILRRFDA